MITTMHLDAMGHMLACRNVDFFLELFARRPFWLTVFEVWWEAHHEAQT